MPRMNSKPAAAVAARSPPRSVPARARPALIAGSPAIRPSAAPIVGIGAEPQAGAARAEVADRLDGVEAGLVAELLAQAAGCRRRGRSGAAAPRRRRGRRRRAARRPRESAGPKSGCGTGSSTRPSRRSARLSEIDPSGATLTAPRTSPSVAASKRAGRVVAVQHLQPRVEAELGRDDRQRQVAGERRLDLGAELGLVAEHAAAQLRVAAGEVLEVRLELADVALEPRPQREAARHLLAEEGRGRGLAAVDRGRAADDDALELDGLLAGGEQLQGPDHVDVVQRPRGLVGLRVPDDPAVDDRVDAGRRQQPARAPGCGCRPRSSPSARGRPSGARVSIPKICSTPGSRARSPGELGPPAAGDAGDRDPAALSHQIRVPTPVLSLYLRLRLIRSAALIKRFLGVPPLPARSLRRACSSSARRRSRTPIRSREAGSRSVSWAFATSSRAGLATALRPPRERPRRAGSPPGGRRRRGGRAPRGPLAAARHLVEQLAGALTGLGGGAGGRRQRPLDGAAQRVAGPLARGRRSRSRRRRRPRLAPYPGA